MPSAVRVVEETWDHRSIVRIVLDAPDKPVNLLTPDAVRDLGEILDRLFREPPSAIVLESAKPGVFIAGADIHVLADISGRAEAEQLARHGRDILWKFQTVRCPTFAAIAGAALGGGLEAALYCDYRIVSDHPKTRLGLPEVQLGIIPGFGGTQTLPRLIGLRPALDLILTGRQIDGRRAEKIGLADRCVPHDTFEDQVRLFVLTHPKKSRMPRHSAPFFLMRELVLALAKRGVLNKTHGQYPAPLRAIEAVRRGVGRPLSEGLRAETEQFAELPGTPECRNLIRTYFLMEKFKKLSLLPPGAPQIRMPENCAVIGAGTMGAGIAGHLASCGLKVRLKDVEAGFVQKGLRAIDRSVSGQLAKRRIRAEEARDRMARVAPALSYEPLRGAGIVIEAVLEDLALKRKVFDELEAAAPAGAILATNTSSLPISKMTDGRALRSRFVGLHFFNPVEKMPLVEVVVADETSDETRQFAVEFVKHIKKTPIVVRDRPGFLVNRLLMPYLNEAVILLSEGCRIESIDAAGRAFGMPMGPLHLIDVVGLDVAEKVSQVLHAAYGERMSPCPLFERFRNEKRLGQKNAKGFYLYDGDKKYADRSIYAALPRDPGMAAVDLTDRLILSMVNEGARALGDGIVSDADTVDVGMLLGAGFPPFRGGLLRYADDRGVRTVVDRLNALADKFGGRFAPAPNLVELSLRGGRFHR